ncbi:PulJ/GspJ family protein [Kosmotoga pacifica]|uniref:N-terminal cleavage protein n=1 Tax=Kosmotoga pacifica TaxID=1330330 RepID=A0A0G2ZFZ8_9BACT|nr:prepilin-type N-terminal cleavage/methylation domain-containing protein [Kosmotoga pacifica]AKI97743.1 hypothetical protein IX53_07875 [Kosmotoga pacifica]
MDSRKNGFSLIEMMITLLVVTVMIVLVSQIYISVNSALNKAYSKMTYFNDVKRGITALWAFDSAGDPSQYTDLTLYEKKEDFFQQLKDEGISSEIIDYLSDVLEFWQLTIAKNNEVYLAVKPLVSWH